jgi:hypothetical protein
MQNEPETVPSARNHGRPYGDRRFHTASFLFRHYGAVV